MLKLAGAAYLVFVGVQAPRAAARGDSLAPADSSAALPAAMVVAMSAMAFAWLNAYADLAARLSRTLKRRRSSHVVNGTVGAVLLALGTRVAM